MMMLSNFEFNFVLWIIVRRLARWFFACDLVGGPYRARHLLWKLLKDWNHSMRYWNKIVVESRLESTRIVKQNSKSCCLVSNRAIESWFCSDDDLIRSESCAIPLSLHNDWNAWYHCAVLTRFQILTSAINWSSCSVAMRRFSLGRDAESGL